MKAGGGAKSLGRVALAFDPPLLPGRLIRRYQRFLADVLLDGLGPVTVHCPNSGSMLGCLPAGGRVYCSPSPRPGRRTAHTWEMVRVGRHWVGINTLRANRLVLAAARQRVPALFAQATAVRPEVKVGDHSRLDLRLERPQGPMFVEVKNVTLVEGEVARFPDAVTSRGAKHLEELMRLRAQGLGAAMVYLVQRGDARAFGPAGRIDPRYARLYHQAREQGVHICALQARVSPRALTLWRELELVS